MADLKSFQEKVKNGDLAGVRAALAEAPALLDGVNESGQSSFLLAKYYRQPEMAEYLLSLNPKLDVFNAAVAGRTSTVLDEIERNKALLGTHSSDGWTPLHLAAFFDHPDLANALLDRGAEIDAPSTNAMKSTPLHAAAAGGNPDMVELLLKRGANVNARQHGGWTALHAAAQSGDRDMVRSLLAHSADMNARAENNQAPLDLALLHGHQDVATLIEGSGAKLQ